MDNHKKPLIDKKTRIPAEEDSVRKSGKNIPENERSDRKPENELKFDYIPSEKSSFSMDGMKEGYRRSFWDMTFFQFCDSLPSYHPY